MNIVIAAKNIQMIRQLQAEAERYVHPEKEEQVYLECDSRRIMEIISSHPVDLIFCEADSSDDPFAGMLEKIHKKKP